ncbi:MAG TPA: hypothetical protein VJ888_06880 [Mobilitalea sp.]|nr:hypothetical protein [Mobilitalea sp.]
MKKLIQPKLNNDRTFKILCIVLGLIMIALLVLVFVKKLNPKEDFTGQESLISNLEGEGYSVAGEIIGELMSSEETQKLVSSDISGLVKFPTGCGIHKTEEEFYIEASAKKEYSQLIDSVYPIFLNNGAYVYLYHNDFTLITEELSDLQGVENTYLNEGKIFDKEGNHEGQDLIVLLRLPNGLYLNMQELKLDVKGTMETIEANSIIRLSESGVDYCSLFKSKLILHKIAFKDRIVMLHYSGRMLTYDAFYDRLNSTGTIATFVPIDEYRVEQELYQFFLGNRYEYKGEKIFYRTRDGYFMECDEVRSFPGGAPLYFTGEQKVLLPYDYVLIQPKLFSMNRLPAMTEITYTEQAIYTRLGETLNTFANMILFDGNNTYLFFSPVELYWGEEQVSLSSLSSVTVWEDGTIDVYQYDSNESLEFYSDGYLEVNTVFVDNTILSLSKDVLYRSDGKEQILFSEPSLLDTVK